jgi:uncharacterized FAD-dependent dehydrogenase
MINGIFMNQMKDPHHPKTHQHITITHLEIPVHSVDAASHYSLDHRLHPWVAEHCRVSEDDVLDYTITHRSLDARRKPDLRYVYKLHATIRSDCLIHEDSTIVVHTPEPDQEHPLYHLKTLSSLPKHPIIVGTGPAGMMAAYLFALYGCEPVILDRGADVVQRQTDIASFLQSRRLNPESNYLFGEGGAGTYSDGKLYTRTKDHRIRFVLEAFVAARAPHRILYDHHPHIGSDILPYMVKRLRRQIEEWGGSFHWGTNVTDIVIRNHRYCGVITASGKQIESPLTLIASGHSARHLIRTLLQHGISYRGKNFQLGCRIEHPQHLIDLAQYGWVPPRHLVGAAEYSLTSRPDKRKCGHHARNSRGISNVTTFCMCPGGEIIAATSDEGQLCTNGMSRFRRDSQYANAGLIVNQDVSRFASVLDALDFIEIIERHAFNAGGNDYRCPAQSALAFVRGESRLHTTDTSYQFGLSPARLDQLLPGNTVKVLCKALRYFETLIPGFLRSGVLIGVETRVSSPVRFERNPETFSSSLPGLYLAGEGAGYASGITSAALDGLRIVETILTGQPATRKASSAV